MVGAQHTAKPFTLHTINKRTKGMSSHPTPGLASKSFQVSTKLFILKLEATLHKFYLRDHILTPCHLGTFTSGLLQTITSNIENIR